ncbi:hypothetical protein H9L01_05170 [Erysipelothrix inopinata]|uniref:Uncharacterized protein n=1 Tax=Erysipelothrix inopinata TaxID=225084 RepID=A0A7G9S1M5_9FIRM|nr:hypothetical protein [Erysipelothrix inopinata]QNN61750.1 hypothetical protein H9L01_05170 [Erysipelothrix inopinata]
MRVIRNICCGMDACKNIIVAAIVNVNHGGISTLIRRSFSIYNNESIDLCVRSLLKINVHKSVWNRTVNIGLKISISLSLILKFF